MTDEAGKFQHAYFFLGAIDSIATPDTSTVQIKMKKAYAPMLSYLASPWTMIIAREAVEEFGDLTEHAIGTGPFMLRNWEKDVKFELEKNPNYRDPKLPYVDRLEYLIAIDPDTTATMFTDRQVDAAVIGANQRERVQGDRSDANYQAVPSQFWRQMRMSPTTPEAPYKAPFDDIRVREAIVRSVNAQEVLDLVYGGDGVLTNGPILPIYDQWTLKEEVVGFDLARAKQLMGEAGVNSFTGDMIWATSPEADQIGEILKQQLAEIGITLNLTPMELAAYYNQTYAYNYTFSHHVPLNNPDPDENLSSYFGRNGRFFKHHNTEIWDLIDKQASELDLEKRKAIVQDVQKKIVLDFPMKFMFTVNLHEFTDPKVKGWFYPVDLYDGRKATAWLDV
jgi:peptide/nickel transport system substrate-binding protein